MNRIVIEQHVGEDGPLKMTVPLGADQAGRQVRVTIEPVCAEKRVARHPPFGEGNSNCRQSLGVWVSGTRSLGVWNPKVSASSSRAR